MKKFLKTHKASLLLSACGLSVFSLPSTALAQDTQTAEQEKAEQSGGFGSLGNVIVVTARKREENVQDAPLSISAFSGDSLAVRGVTSISEVSNLSPNINYQNNPGSGGSSSVASVYIRGIGQRDFLGTIDNGVGFYIDDIVVGRTVGAVVDLYDIDRVEVLRGPQGTLFGRNNIGGALKLHLKKPADEFGGKVELQYGTDNLFRAKGSVDIPLNDVISTKFSGIYVRQDGYVDRPAGGDLGNKNTFALRGAVKFEPSSDLEINIAAEYSEDDDNGPAFTLVTAGALVPDGFAGFYNNVVDPTNCAYPGGLFDTTGTCYNDQFVSDTQNFGTGETYSRTKVFNAKLDIEWFLNDEVTLRSITGYRDLTADFARDSDASPLPIVNFFDTFESEQFTQEFNLSAELFDGAVDFVTGLYYYKETGENINLLQFTIADFQSGAAFGSESYAGYGQATWHITDRLDLTVGGRYTYEEKTFNPDQIVLQNLIGIPYLDNAGNCVLQDEGANLGAGTPGLITTIPAAACPVRILPEGEVSRETKEFTPMVNLAYKATDDLLLYGTYSQGFRSGGFVQRIFPPLPVVPQFEPEFVDSYEVGAKFTSLDGKFTLNGALFYTDYTAIQVRTEVPGFVGQFEDNVGNAEIKGLELEARISPSDTFFVELSYGYTDASYTSIDVDPPLVSTVTVDNSFDHVPKHSVTFGVSKLIELGDAGTLTGRFDGSYKTGFANDPDNSPEIFTPDVTLLNASLRWQDVDERFAVAISGKNLTNRKYITSGELADSIGVGEVVLDRGRQFSITASMNF